MDFQEKSLEVPINKYQIHACMFFALHNEVARSAINVISINVRSGGMSVILKVLNKTFELSAPYKVQFDQEWKGKLLRDMVLHILATGFFAIEWIPSKVIQGVVRPNVMRAEQIIPTIIDIRGQPRRYNIYAAPDQNMLWGGANGGKKGIANISLSDLGEPLEGIQVYEFFEPLPNGRLTSPTIVSMTRLRVLDDMWRNNEFANYHLTHPIWVVQLPTDKNTPDPLANDWWAEKDVEIYTGDFTRRRQKDRRKNFHDSMVRAYESAAAAEARIRNASKVGKEGASAAGDEAAASVISNTPPYVYNFELPEGMTLATPPRPEAISDFTEQATLIWSTVFRVFQIPDQMMFSTRVVYETNAQMAVRLFNENIRDLQEFIQPILTGLYTIAYKNSHPGFVKKIKDSVVQQVQQFVASSTDGERGGKKAIEKAKSSSSTLAAEKSGGDEQSKLSSEEKRVASDPTSSGVVVKKINKILTKTSFLIDEIDNNIGVTVSFNRTPITQLADLQAMYDQNIISLDTYGKHALSVAGLNPSEAMTREEREVEIKRKLDVAKRMTEASAPPKPPGGGPGGGGGAPKPKAKPAAAAASSSPSSPASKEKDKSDSQKKSKDRSAGDGGSDAKKKKTEKDKK